MTPNGFAKLTVTTVVIGAFAALQYASTNSWSSGIATGEPLLPGFARSASDIAALELKQGSQVVTLRQTGDTWGIAERGGYPVKSEKVRKLLIDLGEAKLVEPKTRIADKYAMLELEDPAGKDAKSHGIKVLGKSGKPVGDLVFGKTLPEAFGVNKGGIYVRRVGEQQAWLANRAPELSMATKEWVDRGILSIDASKQKLMTVDQPEGGPLMIKQKLKDGKPDGFEFEEPVPDGKKVKAGETADAIARAYGIIDLEDVRKAVPLPADAKPRTAKLETTDGLTVTYELVKDNNDVWVTLKATSTADTAKEEAERINKRVGGWQFKLADFAGGQLLRTRAEIYEDAKKDEEKK